MKKIKFIGVIICFIISIGLHYVYELLPCSFISVLAPVNESIWEHMKLIISSSLIFSIMEYFIYRKKGIIFNNYILSYSIASLLSIILYLIIYIPLYDLFGHKTYIAIILLFLIFIFLQVVSYYIMNKRNFEYSNYLGIILIITIYYIFGYFTYHPPRIGLFYDYLNKCYGIIKKE